MKTMQTMAFIVVCLFAGGAAFARLPAPTDEQKAKAEEAQAKAAEADKKAAEALAKAQDRVVERYRKEHNASALQPTSARSSAAKPAK